MWIQTKAIGNCSQDVANKDMLINLNAISSVIDADGVNCYVQSLGERAILIAYPFKKIQEFLKKEILSS